MTNQHDHHPRYHKLQHAAGSSISHVTHKLDKIPPRWQFAVFLGGTLLISLILTGISYELYIISGTAQLDLSRPGYKQALSEVTPQDTSDYHYSASGPLDKAALDDFKQKYDALLSKTNGYSAFDPGAMSDDQLNLNSQAVVGPQ